MSVEAPSTPSRKRRTSTEASSSTPSLVTPSASNESIAPRMNTPSKVCRKLAMPVLEERDDSILSPTKRSCFGRNASTDTAPVQSNTRQVYALVNKMTGSIGGNGKYRTLHHALLYCKSFYLTLNFFIGPHPNRMWRCNLRRAHRWLYAENGGIDEASHQPRT